MIHIASELAKSTVSAFTVYFVNAENDTETLVCFGAKQMDIHFAFFVKQTLFKQRTPVSESIVLLI